MMAMRLIRSRLVGSLLLALFALAVRAWIGGV